jgi:lysozyme
MTITDSTQLDARIPRQLAIDVDAAEGDLLTAYPDSLGNWTIGRGHLLPPAATGRSWAGFQIIQSTSDRYFNGDLLSAMTMAEKLAEWPKCDTPARQNALYEICFNMGGKWEQFVNTRKALEAQNWQGVHDGLLDSLWAKQVHGRANRIANQFLTGGYDVAGN